MSQCCNHNCGQGDECPLRAARDLTRGQRFGLVLLGLVWAMAVVAVLTGAKP
jgi:hypothetical protein